MFPLMFGLATMEANNFTLSNVTCRLYGGKSLYLGFRVELGLDLTFTFAFAGLDIYQKHISRFFHLLLNSAK